MRLALIGFGEAGRAVAPGLSARPHGYDRKTDRDMHDAFAANGAVACDDARDALGEAEVVPSLVTADQAPAPARAPNGLAW